MSLASASESGPPSRSAESSLPPPGLRESPPLRASENKVEVNYQKKFLLLYEFIGPKSYLVLIWINFINTNA